MEEEDPYVKEDEIREKTTEKGGATRRLWITRLSPII
jgi:hypothetical protein